MEMDSVSVRRIAFISCSIIFFTLLLTGILFAEVSPDRPFADVDISAAPLPHPKRIDEDGKIVFQGVSKDFLNYFFGQIGYKADQYKEGVDDIVPRVLLLNIKKDWAKNQPVQLKKSLFYRVLLPLVLEMNQNILQDRAQLLELKHKVDKSLLDSLSEKDKKWLNALAQQYKVISDEETFQAKDFPELVLRVDVIPPSLALGQAAIESGYGTSRFAHGGNALFGQWTWDGGMKPAQQRSGKGNYGIKAFDYPLESVMGYERNMNTHNSYKEFRSKRAAMRNGREGNVKFDGMILADTLTSYSERGTEYTKSLKGMMKSNQLSLADSLKLRDMVPVYFEGTG